MDTLQRMGAVTVCLLMNGAMLASTMAAEEGSALQTGSHLQSMSWYMVVVGVVCAAVMVVYAVFACNDCYNSEVSTDCHPATSSGGAKWGGAGGYSSAVTSDVNNSMLTAGFTGEVVIPEDGSSHPLPYALIPSGVPEAQGFRGYESVEMASAPTMSGYGSTGLHQPGLAGYGGQGGYVSPDLHQPALAGYGGSSGGQGGYVSPDIHQPALAGYGGSDFGGSGFQQASLPTYGIPGGGQQSKAGGGGGEQRGGWNVGEGSSNPFPGAHVPLMPAGPEEPPPPYYPSSYQR